MPTLTDRFGRVHSYLRVSVTDRCNFRCVYCMPAEGLSWMPKEELLSFEEIAIIVRAFARLGVTRVRLTGGEPTMRADLEQLVAAIADVPGIKDIAMTTNGHTLAVLAPRLRAAGLRRVNVSLDSLDPKTFGRLTRGGDVKRVLLGIEAARSAGLTPIKLNAVVLRGENDHEVPDIVDYFSQWANDTEVRFIEYMPFEERWHQNVKSRELRERLEERYTLVQEPSPAGAGPARTWRVRETGMLVGFVSPLSEHFCATCNRLRLMTDGHLRTCLAHEDTPSLRDLVRRGATDAELDQAIRTMVMGKPEGHDCQTDGGTLFEGVMTAIGG
jgi:cyclic pyranopterin phosphate synthase